MGAVQNAVFNPRASSDSLAGQIGAGTAMGTGGQLVGPLLSAGIQGVRGIRAGSLGVAGRTLADFSGQAPSDLMRQIAAGNRTLVPGAAPTSVQATQNPGLARLQSVMRALYPNDFAEVAGRQNAARLGALNNISEVTGTAAEAANNAGEAIFREGSQNYGNAKALTERAYAARDPLGQARVGLPVKHVEGVVGKKFGEGSGGLPGALDDLVADIRKLGTASGESSGMVSLDTLQNLRSRASEMAYKASLTGDKRLTAAAAQITDHLDGSLEAAAGRSSMRQVLEEGSDVPQAMYRKGLGEIDFLNGEPGRGHGGKGVSHIVRRRSQDGYDGAQVAMNLPDVIAHGEIGQPYTTNNFSPRVNVGLGDARAVLEQSGNGKWLLTGWDHGAPKGVSQVGNPTGAYAHQQPLIQTGAGASGAKPIIGVPGEYFHPDMARAQREATRARIDQGKRFEDGFAGRMWVDGADGMPKLTGGEIPRAAFNSGATQTQDIAQWGLMGRPGEGALKNYAITNLAESAAPNGILSQDKVSRWMRGRSEALKGLLGDGEMASLNSVRDGRMEPQRVARWNSYLASNRRRLPACRFRAQSFSFVSPVERAVPPPRERPAVSILSSAAT